MLTVTNFHPLKVKASDLRIRQFDNVCLSLRSAHHCLQLLPQKPQFSLVYFIIFFLTFLFMPHCKQEKSELLDTGRAEGWITFFKKKKEI